MINTVLSGSNLIATATIKNRAKVLTDAAWVKVRYRSPSGVITTYDYPGTVARLSQGVYEVGHVVTEAGEWTIRVDSNIHAVDEGRVVVPPTDFPVLP